MLHHTVPTIATVVTVDPPGGNSDQPQAFIVATSSQHPEPHPGDLSSSFSTMLYNCGDT